MSNSPISRECKYFAPHKNQAYAFFIALKMFLPIHIEIALWLCHIAKAFYSKLAP